MQGVNHLENLRTHFRKNQPQSQQQQKSNNQEKIKKITYRFFI